MNKLFYYSLLLFFTACITIEDESCEDFFDSMHDVEMYNELTREHTDNLILDLNKAYKSSSIDELRKYTVKAISLIDKVEHSVEEMANASSDADFGAFTCDCEEGESLSDEVESNTSDIEGLAAKIDRLLKDAIEPNDLSDAKKEIKDTIKEALEILEVILEIEDSILESRSSC